MHHPLPTDISTLYQAPMSSNESDQERFRQQWRDQVSAKGKGKGSEHQYGCCTTGNCELCKDKVCEHPGVVPCYAVLIVPVQALQPKLMTAQPIVVTGFVDLPSLVEITKQLKGGALWSISRDLDHFPVTVSIIFVQQHAAEIFMEKSQQVPLQQDNVPLKVEWSGEDGPGPDIIDKSISSQVFSGHSTRAMGIVMAQGSGIQPGDISGLNDHIVDPPGGIIAMGKQAIKNSDGVVTREVVHVHFNSIDACLMARDIIDGTRKFADCEVMPLPDPCGGITEDTRPRK